MLHRTSTFACPSCTEIIDAEATCCRYCAAVIDPQTAHAAAEVQDKVNQACSDASYIKITALAMWSFLIASLIPFLPLVYFGFLFTTVATIVMTIRWQLRFGNLVTYDPDFVRAERNRKTALLLWVAALPIGFVLRPLLLP